MELGTVNKLAPYYLGISIFKYKFKKRIYKMWSNMFHHAILWHTVPVRHTKADITSRSRIQFNSARHLARILFKKKCVWHGPFGSVLGLFWISFRDALYAQKCERIHFFLTALNTVPYIFQKHICRNLGHFLVAIVHLVHAISFTTI